MEEAPCWRARGRQAGGDLYYRRLYARPKPRASNPARESTGGVQPRRSNKLIEHRREVRTTMTADRALKSLLRLVGGVELCAIPFLFFPVPWMDAVHDRVLGLGPLPQVPIVEYMARSLAALYAVHGSVVFRLSFDVQRFRPLIGFLGWVHVVLG